MDQSDLAKVEVREGSLQCFVGEADLFAPASTGTPNGNGHFKESGLERYRRRQRERSKRLREGGWLHA